MDTLTRGCFANAGSSLAFRTGDWRLMRPERRHRNAPCAIACPAWEIPQSYLARAAEGNLRSAWEMLVTANPLPAITGRVCPHPCEAACNRAGYDEAIAIHSVERFLGDRALSEGWNYPVAAPSADASEVAVVGAGPAGLSAAYHLLRRGIRVTIFEAQPEPGGLLRSAIAPYRLPREVLNHELARLLAAGIMFRPRMQLGRDLSIDELRADFSSVFLAPGTIRARPWTVDGAVRDDLRSGLDLLTEWISIGELPRYERVAIIGGGNTAIDLARVLKFNGTAEVHLITFQALPGQGVEPADAMSAAPREITQAIEEGVVIHDRRGVRRMIQRGDAVIGVEMVHMRELVRGDGRREPVAFEGTETVLKVDHVIPAIGQEIDPTGFESMLGKNGLFQADTFGQLANHSGVFVGGDARRAGGSVSGAIGDGRRAVSAIAAYLKGVAPAEDEKHPPIALSELNLNYFDHAARAQAPLIEPARRSALAEAESSISHEQLDAEAHRCFSCGECMACDNCWTLCPDNAVLKTDGATEGKWDYLFDYDHCKGCVICAHECPVGYIAMAEES
ncbi:MAG TPA: FAD-dependent oxidoreductase [Candidatus Binataceae bacterium]|nr:FAD-dependent oxidoreductase [Candidatus Binataceae bacterium]